MQVVHMVGRTCIYSRRRQSIYIS